MWCLRAAMPKRAAQFDTLRLPLIKIAARVVEMKTQIRLHLPTSCPDQRILRIVLDRIPRLATLPWGADAPKRTRRPQPENPTCHHDGSPPAPDEVRGKAPNSGHIAASGRQNLIAVHQGGWVLASGYSVGHLILRRLRNHCQISVLNTPHLTFLTADLQFVLQFNNSKFYCF